MKLRLLICFLCSLILRLIVSGQSETYSVKRASFSSDNYDEFCPVYYKGGIVFCTNRNPGIAKYSTTEDKGLYKIYFIDTLSTRSWQSSRLFSKNLTTNLNDGPATFSPTGDTIIYSRNLEVTGNMRDISSPRNKLGLFMAVLVDGKWTKIRELRFNNEWYNVTTPCLSADGKKLYFASDKPDGYGGFDIYCSQKNDVYWTDPVNIGAEINTKGNEAYPFMNASGELFFSSDGLEGLGGKDIFYSRYEDSGWLKPVPLDPPVNSQFDDFGFITDSIFKFGYFSSKRGGSLDIYEFRNNIPQIFYTTIQKENQYCFNFRDSGAIEIDTVNLRYEWDFGDNKKASGKSVVHCFPGQGDYSVKLEIFDKTTGDLFFSKLKYKIELRDIEQTYINSPDIVVLGNSVEFDALKSNLPGFKISDYSWDFGDGVKMTGAKVSHKFEKTGTYDVNLGVTLKSESTGQIHKTGASKKVSVLDNEQTKNDFITKNSQNRSVFTDVRKYKNAHVISAYSAESEFQKDSEFQVQLFTSKTRRSSDNVIFKNLSGKYAIEEIYDQESGMYCYVLDHRTNLMDTYYTYSELKNSGFKGAKAIIAVIKDPASRELNGLKKIFGTSTDAFFDSNYNLTSNAYLLLGQVAGLLNKYPAKVLEIKVHTDDTGSPPDKLKLSLVYANVAKAFLLNKGIAAGRLSIKGYGGSIPIASNSLEKGRAMNRRIDFTVIDR